MPVADQPPSVASIAQAAFVEAYNMGRNEPIKEFLTEVQEFERIVRIGLGRATLTLQTEDPSLYRDAILRACLHDQTYDSQVEGSRAQYVLDLVHLSGDPDYFRSKVIAALQTENNYDDLGQLFESSRMFAEEGSEDARSAMYARFAEASHPSFDRDVEFPGAEEIILLDGIKGFLFVAETLGEQALSEEDYWDTDGLIRLVEEQAGAEASRREIASVRSENPRIAAYLDRVERTEREAAQAAKERVDVKTLSYETIKPHIEEFHRYPLERWGRYADQQSLEQAAIDLLAEKASDRILAYLRVFSKAVFPFGPQPLIPFAGSDDGEIRRSALLALRNISHPLVRDLAIERLRSPIQPRVDYLAMDLLEKNYKAGDHKVIEQALAAERDQVVYHWLGLGAIDVFEANPTPDCVPTTLTLYENGPCSECRGRCVELLNSLNMLPDWMIQECVYDANLDLREKAKLWQGSRP